MTLVEPKLELRDFIAVETMVYLVKVQFKWEKTTLGAAMRTICHVYKTDFRELQHFQIENDHDPFERRADLTLIALLATF